ncbi:MAG: sulfur carrier protein ThiS [Proteobacteria bacterium]|nr:sulfur carrier protein ThiS [Pseudomonadota bacterium]
MSGGAALPPPAGGAGGGSDTSAQITLNGAPQALIEPNLQALLARLGHAERRGIAVALNDSVVPRERWAATALRSGDRLELLVAVQGG